MSTPAEMTRRIGFLHPGSMGISVAVAALDSGCQCAWVSQGRSVETRERAETHGLLACESLAELCEICDIIISVCPPHAALEVAHRVIDQSFQGMYADVNAIAPEKAKTIHQLMVSKNIDFVDGGIIGGPAWEQDSTCLYLCGGKAAELAACFKDGLLMTEVLGHEIGKASALKMSYAAYSKGSTALLCGILAAAEEMGVRENLEKQWNHDKSDFTAQTHRRLQRVTAKAWRFSGEMEEIASTLKAVGLPDGFHLAAADIYRRLKDFKKAETLPEVEKVLEALISK